MVPIVNVAGGPGISQVSGTGTTDKVFPLLTGGQIFFNTLSTNPAPTYSATVAASLAYPGSGRLEGKYSQFSASGWVKVAGVSPTVLITLEATTGSTVPGLTGNTTLLACSAQTLVTSASYPWLVQMVGIGDTQSGLFEGWATFQIGANFVASAAITPLTGLTWSNSPLTAANSSGPNVASEPVFSVAVGITFGVSNAANTAQLDQMVLEA